MSNNPYRSGSWERAAYIAVSAIVSGYHPGAGATWSIDDMENYHAQTDGFKSAAGTQRFGHYAWKGWCQHNPQSYGGFQGIVDVLAKKQHDYGNDNILKWGAEGIKIRTWDKLARIRNLEKRGGGSANEPLSDAWFDCLGYAVIAYMLLMGTFTRPLEADMVSAEKEALDALTWPGSAGIREGQMIKLEYLGYDQPEGSPNRKCVYRIQPHNTDVHS